VFDRRVLLAHGVAVLRLDRVTEDLGVVVDGPEPVDALLQVPVEAVVGGAHVGEQGVAAHRRDLDGVQHRPERGTPAPRDVGVPAVLVATDGRFLLEPDEFGLVGVRRDERMDLEVAEPPGERHVLGRRERLIAEEQDLELVEAAGELGDDLVGEWSAQVESLDLGADRHPDLADPECGEAQAPQPVPLGGQVADRPHLHAPGLEPHPPGTDVGGRVALGCGGGDGLVQACRGRRHGAPSLGGPAASTGGRARCPTLPTRAAGGHPLPWRQLHART
jgi:hypothetical protein